MNSAILSMLSKYKARSLDEEERALKEVIQEVALLGLWRSKFFEHAAFYGETALRIFYGLDRFSEDIDFSLTKKHENFRLDDYLNAIKSELQSYGFMVSVEKKVKSTLSSVESAFIKGNTQTHLIHIGSKSKTHRDRQIKIKLEVDTDPPEGANFIANVLLMPIPFSVLTYDLPSLFAGKLHAALCRQRVQNVKGRDWYDVLWYVGRGVAPNIFHLEKRMRQSGHYLESDPLTLSAVKYLLDQKLRTIDMNALKEDIRPFIFDTDRLEAWDLDLFLVAVGRITESSSDLP
ncbi:MAG: nucleotidyl transferase AbiEii/AbiGii toxin family protein [Pseudomonadota bacterium]